MINRKWLGILIVAFMVLNVMIATAYAAGSSDLLGQVQQYAKDNGKGIVTDFSNAVTNIAKILMGKKVLGGYVKIIILLIGYALLVLGCHV